MPTLVSDVGSATANSYVAVADATTYFDERLNAGTWSTSDDDRARALIQATRRIDQERFRGEKVSSGQALKWPRYWALDDDGEEYSTASIPQIVQDATCELALYLLNQGTTDPLMNTGLEQFKSARVGPMAVETRPAFSTGQLPDNVESLLRPVLVHGITARMYRT